MTAPPVLLLDEYKAGRLAVPPPSAADQQLAEWLSTGDRMPRLTVRWLAGGVVEVQADSWVGVARFSGFEVHVTPKLVGGPLNVLRMAEYAAGLDLLRRLPTHRHLVADGSDLFDLLCLLLCEETRVLLRDGLIRNYRPEDDTLAVLRGRLHVKNQLLRRYGQLQTLECNFEEYDSNTIENQLLAAAFQVARRRARSSAVRATTLQLSAVFDEACVPPTDTTALLHRSVEYDRRNERYRVAHELARIVLAGSAFDRLFETGDTRVHSFMLDMNVVFEQFVTRLVSDVMRGSGFTVSAQRRVRGAIVDEASGRSYSELRPDLVLEDSSRSAVLPIDVKYKLYDDAKVRNGDVYQLFTYAYALSAPEVDRRAGVIYPTTQMDRLTGLMIHPPRGVRDSGAHIRFLGLPVERYLDGISPRDGQLDPYLAIELRRRVVDLVGGSSLHPG